MSQLHRYHLHDDNHRHNHRSRRPHRLAVAVVALATGAMLAGLLAHATGKPVAAQTGQRAESVNCPTMTDSVDRLFLAFFNREPDATEFRRWTVAYRTGEAGLEQIAEQLAGSDEFRSRYGNLDAGGYVELVYRNTLRRTAEQTDVDFWITSLESGYGRGAMMMAFSESEEFVRRTGTATPLAGFLRWYPQGTRWYCGVGRRDSLPIQPLTEPTIYADYLFNNEGDTQTPIRLSTSIGADPYLTITDGSLPPGFTSYKWGGLFSGDGGYGDAVSILATEDTSWVVVFYPSQIGDERTGWQIRP